MSDGTGSSPVDLARDRTEDRVGQYSAAELAQLIELAIEGAGGPETVRSEKAMVFVGELRDRLEGDR